jgi:YVTN family beta-propeller protein
VVDGQSLQTLDVGAGHGPAAIAVNPVTNRVFVASTSGHTVMLLDGAANQTATMSAGTAPSAVAVSPTTHRVYVANTASDTVSVYDPATAQTTTISVGTSPVALALNAGTNQIYVANNGDNSLSVIDGSSNHVTPVPVGVGPVAVAVNTATNQLYVSNGAGKSVTVVEGGSLSTTPVALGVNPGAIAANPVTNQIYVVTPGNDSLAVIDGPTLRITTVKVGNGPSAVAVNAGTNQVYVANGGDGTVTILNGSTPAQTVTVGTNPSVLAVNPFNGKVYVGNTGANSMSVIDGAGQVTTLNLTAAPLAIAANTTNGHVYVSSANGTLSAIDAFTTAGSAMSVGASASALDVDPTAAQVYVANPSGASFTAVSGQRTQSIPLTTKISSLPQNQTIPRTPGFTFTVTDGYQPTAPTLLGVYYQVDSWTGEWRAAQGSGTTFTAQVGPLSSGPHVLYAYAADVQASGSTVMAQSVVGAISSYAFNVVEGQSGTTLSSSANPSETGESITLTASVAATAPATGTPTGVVTFMDGSNVLAPWVSLDSNGQATFTTSNFATATHSLTAVYYGDANVMGSTAALSQAVNQGSSNVQLVSSANPSALDQAVTFTASVQAVSPAVGMPTGTVSFSDGATVLASGVAVNSSGQASFSTAALAAGGHSITVSYSGDKNFAPSASTTLTQAVGRGGTTTILSSGSNPSYSGNGVTLSVQVQPIAPATVTPTGTVTFFDGATALGAASALDGQGKASLTISSLSTGTHNLTASYSGDATYAQSTSSAVAQLVNPATLSVALGQNPLSVADGHTGLEKVQITSNGVLGAPITVSCSGLPAASQCSFSPTSVSPTALPASVSISISTIAPQMAAARPGPGPSAPWTSLALVLPGVLWFAGTSRRMRSAGKPVWAVFAVLALTMLLGLAGCGGSSSSPVPQGPSTPPGTYTVMITATAGSVQTSTPMTLTVTP